MLTVPPVAQNGRSDTSSQGLNGYMKWIENEKEESSLLKALDALANNIKDTRSNEDAKKKTQGKTIDPTPSSSPTGGKWTLDAISKTVKDVFHISPGNVAAIREMLTLPISQQLYLLKSISERLVDFF
ncbi:hypothetical protein K501DRAFT_99138 [Backusella circina FSU 941]|nr:hypothetical protein K501DRAFT_99138 [Backusella circina FSU 941]